MRRFKLDADVADVRTCFLKPGGHNLLKNVWFLSSKSTPMYSKNGLKCLNKLHSAEVSELEAPAMLACNRQTPESYKREERSVSKTKKVQNRLFWRTSQKSTL